MTAPLAALQAAIDEMIEEVVLVGWLYEVMAFEAFLDLLNDPEFDAHFLFAWEERLGVDFSDLEEWMLP
ncbi:hypothetical protein P1P75_00935 [Streptomyces sp. ID05-39B]|uniref:hypothetical protein n=1 Tax=Streptomyces sp. ID05-39B TaxID=3028664 RepID=UPI0029A1E477|nr:hypothetical protein [Streptomyces sp. ID05-39B]MDX3525053.1 hypothetical protein [Streptomyces sp. ID05-39B]